MQQTPSQQPKQRVLCPVTNVGARVSQPAEYLQLHLISRLIQNGVKNYTTAIK